MPIERDEYDTYDVYDDNIEADTEVMTVLYNAEEMRLLLSQESATCPLTDQDEEMIALVLAEEAAEEAMLEDRPQGSQNQSFPVMTAVYTAVGATVGSALAMGLLLSAG